MVDKEGMKKLQELKDALKSHQAQAKEEMSLMAQMAKLDEKIEGLREQRRELARKIEETSVDPGIEGRLLSQIDAAENALTTEEPLAQTASPESIESEEAVS